MQQEEVLVKPTEVPKKVERFSGLTEAEARLRLRKFGFNEPVTAKKRDF